jgi:hypothetical protein
MLINCIATIKYSEFTKILADEFKNKKPSEALMQAMYERFKRFKFTDNGHDIDRNQ